MQPIFARIYKVDEETRTVTGRAAQEVVDRDNELFDYASSKPEFMKWSAEVHADSNGQSLGNVRSMHGNVAAGKLTDIQFLDEERAIDVSAKIVDDNEWRKCVEGVHTGFSIGGRYAKKWPEAINGKMVNRYTAVPSEISIVDRPCIPTAKFFSLHKRDGSVEQVPFARPIPALVDGALRLAKDATTGASGAGAGWGEPAEPTTGVQSYAPPGRKKRVRKEPLSPQRGMEDGGSDDDDLEQAAKIDTDVKDPDAADEAHKRKFSDKARAAAASSGAALPDGSFPIKTAADLKNAVLAHGRAKDKAKAKAHIVARAKALNASHLLPDGWAQKADADGDLRKFWARHGEALTQGDLVKGVFDVASLAQLIAQLHLVTCGAFREREVEGDDSQVPDDLRAAASKLLSVLADMAQEESKEMADGDTAEDIVNGWGKAAGIHPGMYSTGISDLAKALRMRLFGVPTDADEPALQKRGARNSKKDLATIQSIHDATCELGAGCAPGVAKSTGCVQSSDQETTQMASRVEKADTIATEGNKRGAAVTNPTLEPESDNAADAEAEAKDTGAVRTTKGKPRKGVNPFPQKSSARDEDDMDDDDDDDDSEDDDDDDDDEEQVRKEMEMAAKARKAKKAAKRAAKAAGFSSEDLAKAVAAGVAAALSQMNIGGNVKDPRIPPALMAVSKDGTVAKMTDIEALKKSVDPVQYVNSAPRGDAWQPELDHRGKPTGRMVGDNDTLTLIKAIRSRPEFRLSPFDIPSN